MGTGTRVLMWKQDPSVSEIGTRKVFLPGLVLDGPRNARIMFGQPGISQVSPNAFGDFVTMPDTPQFDAVYTYAVVRQTLTMYQRVLADGSDDTPLPWQWNSSADLAPIGEVVCGARGRGRWRWRWRWCRWMIRGRNAACRPLRLRYLARPTTPVASHRGQTPNGTTGV